MGGRRGRDRAEVHLLAGAYALNALSGPDQARFERHLAGCEQCRLEVRGFAETAARLGASQAVRPRPELRDQALRTAARTRQLPPGPGLRPGRARPGAAPARARRRRPGAGPWPRWAAAGVAAAVLAAATVAGVTALRYEHRISQDQASGHELAAVLSAPDVVMLTAKVTGGGKATVLMSHHMRALVFAVAGLPPLPAAKGYELWLIGPSGSRPQGMLPAGPARPVMVAGLAHGDQVGVTVEPRDGSAQPTTRPLLLMPLE
ncbi:MAG TPA: anti-sigma factor [Streptosporangiaceae bacterium]